MALDWFERDLNGSDAGAFFKSRPRDLIRSQGGGDPARSDCWRILSHSIRLTWLLLAWILSDLALFYAAVLALSPNELPFEPFDQAFPADCRARPTTVTMTVDRCGTGILTRAGARMACELTRNKLYWSYRRPQKKANWRCNGLKKIKKKNTGVAKKKKEKRNILALLF